MIPDRADVEEYWREMYYNEVESETEVSDEIPF